MIAAAGLLIAVNLLFLAAGLGVTSLVGWWRGRQELVSSLGISYLAGVAAYGVLAQLLYVSGASLSRRHVIALCAVLSLGMIRGLRVRGGRLLLWPPAWVLVVPGLFLALLALDLWHQPLWAYDSWAFWTPRAYGLFTFGGLDTDWFTSADMLGGARRDYPLLLPAVEAAGFHFMGYEPRLLDVQSWFLLVGLLIAIVEVSAARTRNVVLAATLVMLVVAPSTAAQLANAEADIPLAVFVAAAGMCAVLWLESRRPSTLLLAGVLATGGAAVKLEGPIFVGAMFVALAACAWQRRRRDALTALGVLAVVIALGVVPWRVWVLVHGGASTGEAPSLAATTLLDQVSYVPQAAAYLVYKLLDPGGWLFIVPLGAVAAWVAWRAGHRRVVAFVLLTIGIAFTGIVVSYWSTPLDLHHHLATSARRVVTSIVFLCAAVTPLLAGRGRPAEPL